MSADRRATMGVKHLTVVPENYPDIDADEESADRDVEDASVPRHR